MKKIRERVIKGVIFVGIFFILFGIFSYILQPKNNDRASGMDQPTAYAILAEKENTIDTLVIGDSESYSSISPMQIWEEHGYTTYVCGTPAQRLYQSLDFLEKALETQKPKIVILEVNSVYRKYSIFSYVGFEVQERFPLFKYHNRWKSLTEDDFQKPIEYTWKNELKGFDFDRRVKSTKFSDYMRENKKSETLTGRNRYFLDEILQLCDDNDIKLVLMSAPSIKNWNYEKHAGVEAYARENKIEYIDMNLFIDEIGIDWVHDTRDKGDHVNFEGAQKVTHFVGNYLKNTGLLSSHKGDKNYDMWNDDLDRYKARINKK